MLHARPDRFDAAPDPSAYSGRPVAPSNGWPGTGLYAGQVGDPAALGIRDVQRPDFGDAVPVALGEVPVFWACGVTPQAVMMQAKPVLALTHVPGHMFISDRRDSTLAVL